MDHIPVEEQASIQAEAKVGFVFFAILACILAACAQSAPVHIVKTPPTAVPLFPMRDFTATLPPISRWETVLSHTPYPYTTPLPPDEQTIIDGTYALFDPGEKQWMICARCPDYAPYGGLWRLQFDKGVMRMIYLQTGWTSLASYTLAGDQLFLFNDPSCIYEVGAYTWKIKAGELALQEVKDECAIHLRAKNLTRPGWRACAPPGGAAEGWEKPDGCEE